MLALLAASSNIAVAVEVGRTRLAVPVVALGWRRVEPSDVRSSQLETIRSCWPAKLVVLRVVATAVVASSVLCKLQLRRCRPRKPTGKTSQRKR